MLLSRLANYLFWFGRYIERTEHSTRFIKIQHYAAMETPHPVNKEIIHNSVVNMFGIGHAGGGAEDPGTGLDLILLTQHNPNSILSTVGLAKANVMNVRNVISVEIWEAVNRFYLFVHLPAKELKDMGLNFDFMQRVLEFCSLIRNLINSSLLHDETWAIIRFGIYLERAIQINRIMSSHLSAYQQAKKAAREDGVEHQMVITLLKSLQARDMFYKSVPQVVSPISVSEFLICNRSFPRSISYNLHKCQQIYNRIFPEVSTNGAYLLNKLADSFKYIRTEDLEPDPLGFLDQNRAQMEQIAYIIERDHLQI